MLEVMQEHKLTHIGVVPGRLFTIHNKDIPVSRYVRKGKVVKLVWYSGLKSIYLSKRDTGEARILI